MRYQQDCAIKFSQNALQNFLRWQVKMIGGFIQQQQVGALQRKAGQCQTAAFATGKDITP